MVGLGKMGASVRLRAIKKSAQGIAEKKVPHSALNTRQQIGLPVVVFCCRHAATSNATSPA